MHRAGRVTYLANTCDVWAKLNSSFDKKFKQKHINGGQERVTFYKFKLNFMQLQAEHYYRFSYKDICN